MSTHLPDPDQINPSNFTSHLLPLLSLPQPERTELHISLMQKCTSHFPLFASYAEVDPGNVFNAHSMGCRYLTLRISKKESFLITHRDQPKEFFILLEGKVGVFKRKNDEQIQDEIHAVNWLISKFKEIHKLEDEVEDVPPDAVLDIRNEAGIGASMSKKVEAYLEIKKKQVIYKEELFNQMTGGLSLANIKSKHPEFFLEDQVNLNLF